MTSRPQLIHILLLTGLLAACSVGPGATATPTGSPSPTGSPPPTASPSPIPSPTFGPEQIPHPTGANDVVLRMASGGGHMIFGFDLVSAPQFTLYGDGTVIFQQIDNRGAPFGAVPNLPWLVAHLDEEEVQALLQFALGPGRLANARDSYDNPMIADAGSTIFVLNAAGLEKVVNIYALFEMPDAAGPDAADRAGFAQLQAALNDFQNQEGLGDVTVYEPEFYRVTLLEGFGQPSGELLEWPWDDLTMDDFPSGDEPGGIAILDADHVAKLMEVPNGGQFGIWIEAPDGNPLQAAIRPLLPDEAASIEP